MKQKISITLNEKVLRDVDSQVDNIVIRNRSQAIEFLIQKSLKESKTAVILAGENKDNKLMRVKNRYGLYINHLTIIERAIKNLRDSGFKKIYIIATHNTLTNIFRILGDGSSYNVKIEFVKGEESEQGSAAALKLLRGEIKTTFMVVFCDIIFDDVNLDELWQQHLKEKMVATLLLNSSVMPYKKERGRGLWGHVKLEGTKILSFIEKPTPPNMKSSLFFNGIFVAEPEIFRYEGGSLELDIFQELVRRRLLGGQVSSADYLHVHTLSDLREAKKKLYEKKRA